jgi:hypothetical protein
MTDDIRILWQADDTGLAPLPLDEVKRRAATFDGIVGRRNRREYIAAAFVAAAFAVYAAILPEPLLKIGSLLVIAGTFFVTWQLTLRSPCPDPAAEAADIRSHYRDRLVREEHMLARVGLWYLAPMLPGLLVFMVGQALAAGSAHPLGFAAYVALPLMLFTGIWLLNRRAAAMLRLQIDRIDRTAPPKET